MPDFPAILLVDNGSLQPLATLHLRCLAAGLAARLDRPVEPVSLLHSSAIDPGELGGRPAEILEPAIVRRFEAGVREFLLVPLFFGPSRALTDYIPERIEALRAKCPGLTVHLAAPVCGPSTHPDHRLAEILADHVRQTAQRCRLDRPWVVLVDHGSPQPAVAAVRDQLALQLAARLSDAAGPVLAASMERREGPEYDFNEPLLARALESVEGPGIVALLFFSPGRHAGPGGDIQTICREAQEKRPGLQVHFTPLVGEHPCLLEILADRVHAAMAGRDGVVAENTKGGPSGPPPGS